MNHRDLDIWKLAQKASVEIHAMTLKKLPKFEMYETGSQIRRSSKSVRSNIVEGHGRRRYKAEFIRFLIFSHASCDETIDHLDTLFETASLADEPTYRALRANLDNLGGTVNHCIASVEHSHRTTRGEPDT
jgi:four helix bundle protein